jgi:glutamine amidotransferase
MGDTDSEHAFCFLLDRLALAGDERPVASGQIEAALAEPIALLSELGEFNVLLSDGDHLVAYANTKLHRVQRTCVEGNCRQQVVVLATTPLTDEPWRPVELGRIHIFAGGAETRRTEVAA